MYRAAKREFAMDQDEDDAEFDRLPGLYRAWDIPCILQADRNYRIDACEPARDGTPLFAVFASRPLDSRHSPSRVPQ
jgi:hypothetical protein